MAHLLPTAGDLRELSFQQVVDQVFKPNGVKVGGFPEELFLDLTDEQKERWTCNICFLITNEPCECDNKHLFCRTCIFAWSLTYGENSQKCPMCRCEMDKYPHNKEVQKLLEDKRVSCQETSCTFRAPLKIFLMHSHGKKLYSNGHVDLESLRPARQEPSAHRIIMLPPMFNRAQRGAVFRSQLEQGRSMINQMMLLLHLEMNLRQQALTSYTQAHDPVTRLARLDEVLALNEQLNEVGGILSNLLNSPLNQLLTSGTSRNQGPSRDEEADEDDEPAIPASSSTASALTGAAGTSTTPLRISAPVDTDDDDEDDDDDDDDSDDSDQSDASTIRRRLSAIRNRREAHSVARTQPQPPLSTALTASMGSSSIGPNTRARRPSEIRAGLSLVDSSQSSSATAGTSSQAQPIRGSVSSSEPAPRLQQRVLLNRGHEPTVRSRSRQSTVTVQRLGADGSSSSSGGGGAEPRSSLPSIPNASPRPDVSPEVPSRSTVIPAGSSTLHRTLQSMGEDRSRSRAGRSNLTPRTNGEFAANILSGSNSNVTSGSPSSVPSVTPTPPSSQTPNSVARNSLSTRPRSSVRPPGNQATDVQRSQRLARSQSRPRQLQASTNRTTAAAPSPRRASNTTNRTTGATASRNPHPPPNPPPQGASSTSSSHPGPSSTTTRRASQGATNTTTTPQRRDSTDSRPLLRARRRSEIHRELTKRSDNGS